MSERWRTLANKKLPDFEAFIRENANDAERVIVGTDSLQTGRFTQYVTIVALLFPRHSRRGGRAVFKRAVEPREYSLRRRLSQETWLSVDVALRLVGLGTKPGLVEIHIDANTKPQFKSSEHAQELVGMAVGQGFRAVLKPDSVVASHVADHVVRHLGKFPRAA